MKKQLSCALLTLGLIGLNVMPAKAMSEVSDLNLASTEAVAPGQLILLLPFKLDFFNQIILISI